MFYLHIIYVHYHTEFGRDVKAKEAFALEELLQLAHALGFTAAAPLAATLTPLPAVRQMCRENRCGCYATRWSCPPGCGSFETLAGRLARCDRGILVQTTARGQDAFDLEAIRLAEQRHKERFSSLARRARQLFPDCLPLSAGGCRLCIRCTYPKAPCRFPHRMLPSREAYGLLVADVCRAAHLPYYYGENTVTFTSCVLLAREEPKERRP